MAEDELRSGKAKFKNKWARAFANKEEHKLDPKHTNSFKLDDDVTAFLKPSTDKAASTQQNYPAPKIDIAIAQRWPEANEVRRPSATPGSGQSGASTPNGFTKPPRRKGLRVGFVKTAPEIIGEGGDEALDPPTEVGRQKAARPRAVSDVRPSQWSASSQGEAQAFLNKSPEQFRPQPVRRAQTSHDEYSPIVQKKQMSTSVDVAEAPPRPVLSRAPTGFSSEGETPVDEDDHMEYPVPKIETKFSFEESQSPGDLFSFSPRSGKPQDPNTLATRRKEFGSGEGMVLRRGSRMMHPEDEEGQSEQQKRQSLGMGVKPTPELYDRLSQPDAPSTMPGFHENEAPHVPPSTTSSGRSPFVMVQAPTQRFEAVPAPDVNSATSEAHELKAVTSPMSPVGASPFDDPKYVKQKPQGTSTSNQQLPASQSLRERRPQYQPSYMSAAQPDMSQQPIGRRAVPGSTLQPGRSDEHEPIAIKQNPSDYRGVSQPSSGAPMSNREPSAQSQRSHVHEDSSQTRPPPPFFPSHGSAGSFDSFSEPVSRTSQTQTSSRDGSSPRQLSFAFGLPQPAPTRLQTQSPGSQASSRSSTPMRPTGHSPYFRTASPNTATSSAERMQLHGPASTPGSTGSGRPLQAPVVNFSGPMQRQSPPAKSPAITLQQEGSMRPSSSSSTGPSQRPPRDYFASAVSTQKLATGYLRQGDAQRPGSASSGEAAQRPAISPQPTAEGNPAADVAYADFSARVAHMKGVFRLTAEREQPLDRCSPQAWLRTALWWYLRGKSGLEVMLKQRARNNETQPRELLTQPHVDLAKTWWILSEPLQPYDTLADATPQSVSPLSGGPGMILRQSVAVLRSHIKSLCLSVGRARLMPPHQSLIQGQNTSIWIEYPRFTTDAAAVLGGSPNNPLYAESSRQSGVQPLELIPICDTRDTFCYGRFLVEVSINTDEAQTDRVVMLCMLSMLRSKRDFLTNFVIASQSELVNVDVRPRQDRQRGLTWRDVSWKAASMSLVVHLAHGFDLTVRMQESDFKSLWNLSEYARKVEHRLRPEQNERLVHDARLTELQYADSLNANAFPGDKVKGAMALVFERVSEDGRRKVHQGYRLLLVTDPSHKSLASAQHDVCHQGPLYFEFVKDASGNGTTAMTIRIRESNRQCTILLTFPSVAARQNLYNILNGLSLGPEENTVSEVGLGGMNIELATQIEGLKKFSHPALRSLQWSNLNVTNGMPQDSHSNVSSTVESESLRIIARHATGCITDRLNVSKGELLIRLPCVDKPTIQFLRGPQEDIGMSIDIRNAGTNVAEGITELMQMTRQQSTIRTFTFASAGDLHSFQAAITGCSVRYDGLASTLSIARRRMVVPIYKKWEASNVRLQTVSHSSVVQILAFMEGFSHADALCFQIKSTDSVENVKGDSKGKKWAVRLIDAKFTLPHEHEEKEKLDMEEKVRRRFVNLEGLEYAEEHDDITIGFDTQDGMPLNLRSCCFRSSADIHHRTRPIRTVSTRGAGSQSWHYAQATHMSSELPSRLHLWSRSSSRHLSAQRTAFFYSDTIPRFGGGARPV